MRKQRIENIINIETRSQMLKLGYSTEIEKKKLCFFNELLTKFGFFCKIENEMLSVSLKWRRRYPKIWISILNFALVARLLRPLDE